MHFRTIREIQTANKKYAKDQKAKNEYFFSKMTLSILNTKLESPVINGCFFITSNEINGRKSYHVQKAFASGKIRPAFYKKVFATRQAARDAMNAHIIDRSSDPKKVRQVIRKSYLDNLAIAEWSEYNSYCLKQYGEEINV